MPSRTCTRCQKNPAVWCRCYSDATIALSLCESCLRGVGDKVCWICKRADKRWGKSMGGCCYDCGLSRRCSKCDFFEYAPGRPTLGSRCPRCEAPFRASPGVAVVVVAQSVEGNVCSRDYRSIRKAPEGSRCLSCVHLDLQVCRKMSARSTWCKTCISLHRCKVCEKLTHVVDKVPLCSTCTVKNVKNYAQWVCDACRTDGVPPLTYCKGCESLAVSSEGQLSEGDTRSLDL